MRQDFEQLDLLPDASGETRVMPLQPRFQRPAASFSHPPQKERQPCRERTKLSNRLDRAGFTETQVFEDFDWDAPISFDLDRVRDLFGLGFLDRREDVIFLGPVAALTREGTQAADLAQDREGSDASEWKRLAVCTPSTRRMRRGWAASPPTRARDRRPRCDAGS